MSEDTIMKNSNANAEASAGSSTTETEELSASNLDSGVLDVRFLFIEILKKWWLIAIFAGYGGWNGVQNMHGFTPVYNARMVVMPLEGGSAASSSVGNSASVMGAIAGISISSAKAATKLDRLVHATTTLTLARILDTKYGLMDSLYGGSWDKEKNTWRRPTGNEFEIREKINSYLKLPTWSPPNIESLSGFISSSFKAEEVPETPYKTLTFTHSDPEKALYFLKMVYQEANEFIRKQDSKERQLRRIYLEDRLNNTTIKDFQGALVNLLGDEAREDMMAQGNRESVARVLDPPYVSARTTSPSMLRHVGFPVVFASSIAVGLILLFVLFRRE
jgi:hypothetical protein